MANKTTSPSPVDIRCAHRRVSWEEFRNEQVGKPDADDYLFRGQSDPSWRLISSFDRTFAHVPPDKLDDEYQSVINDFTGRLKFGTTHDVGAALDRLNGWDNFDLMTTIAQHYGLPTLTLDWTRSPFVAAWFAVIGMMDMRGFITVWRLTRSAKEILRGVLDIHYPDAVLPRIANQHSVLTLIKGPTRDLELVIAQTDPSLIVRYDIGVSDRSQILDELRLYGLHYSSMFPDVNGIAMDVLTRALIRTAAK